MIREEYERWLAHDLEDPDLLPELLRIKDSEDEINDRFAVSLKFGTAGLRGTLGAGTNRMNIWVVRQATQGLANWVDALNRGVSRQDVFYGFAHSEEFTRICTEYGIVRG